MSSITKINNHPLPQSSPHLAAFLSKNGSKPFRALHECLRVKPPGGRASIRRDLDELPRCAACGQSPYSCLYTCVTCAAVHCHTLRDSGPSHAADHVESIPSGHEIVVDVDRAELFCCVCRDQVYDPHFDAAVVLAQTGRCFSPGAFGFRRRWRFFDRRLEAGVEVVRKNASWTFAGVWWRPDGGSQRRRDGYGVSGSFSSVQALSASSKSQTGLHVLHEQKLKDLKETLANAREDPLQQLVLVDAMQRLGVAYHFHEEVGSILEKQYAMSSAYNCNDNGTHQLFEASLRFRLLRQQGFPVTPNADVFIKIKNNEKLKSGQIAGEDIKGLVELFEASHLSFQGEETLDKAGKLSRQLLTAWIPNNLTDHRSKLVAHTLEHPCHKSLTRFTAKKYLNNFQGQEKWASSLQELARLEFDMVEGIIRNEILQVSRWWKELGLTKELPFVRDQPIKWYTWPMASLVDSRLSEERIELTKALSLVYIIDDIFDVHGTLDELVLFTAAVVRWDTATGDDLPHYMKTCFKAINEIINDISDSVYEKHGWNPTETLRESWARLCKAFLVEAQWFRDGQSPNSEDYLKNGIISSGVPAVLTHAFFILGQGMTRETVDLLNNINLPGIVSSTATILRLWDDFGSAMDEEQNGYDGSYIECYLNEHPGSSVEEAKAYVIGKISDEWKYLNQECFSCNPFPESFTQLALNGSRMVPMMYDYNAHHRLPSLEENMKSLLLDGFPAKGITHD